MNNVTAPPIRVNLTATGAQIILGPAVVRAVIDHVAAALAGSDDLAAWDRFGELGALLAIRETRGDPAMTVGVGPSPPTITDLIASLREQVLAVIDHLPPVSVGREMIPAITDGLIAAAANAKR